MTFENENILTDFYSGNSKDITVTVWEDEAKTIKKDLTNAVVTYAIFMSDSPYTTLLRKSSHNGGTLTPDEIEILAPAANGVLVVKLKSGDTINLTGDYRHHVNVIDGNDDVATILTGRIRIFKGFANAPVTSSKSAYLEGG